MSYTKAITNATTGETEIVDMTPDEVTTFLADRAVLKAGADAAKAAEDERQADIDLVRKAQAALNQLQSDLTGIDSMNAVQTRDVVKHLLTINISMVKALQRIL